MRILNHQSPLSPFHCIATSRLPAGLYWNHIHSFATSHKQCDSNTVYRMSRLIQVDPKLKKCSVNENKINQPPRNLLVKHFSHIKFLGTLTTLIPFTVNAFYITSLQILSIHVERDVNLLVVDKKQNAKTYSYRHLLLLQMVGNKSFSCGQGRNEEGQRGHNSPGVESLRGVKSANNFTRTFFNTVHLFSKDLRIEHRGAKLASCPGRHLTSLRPGVWQHFWWTWSYTAQSLAIIYVFKKLET